MMAGRIKVSKTGDNQTLTTLQGGYPVKYIARKRKGGSLPQVYALSFGGGLV
jgi:hypothetical protein